MNANGEVVDEAGQVAPTTAGMEAMAEEGVVADGMQPGVAQGSVVNANGEVVDDAGQVASVEGTTPGMEAMADEGVVAEKPNNATVQTGLPNVVTDYNEMVPNSYLRDPTAVSDAQKHLAESPVVPAVTR